MKKPLCLFACTYSPLVTEIKSGGIGLTKANYEALIEGFDVIIVSSLIGKQNIFNKLMRFFWVLFGYMGGNNYFFELKWKKNLMEQSPDLIFIDHSQLGRLAKVSKIIVQSKRVQEKKPLIVTHFQNVEINYIKQSGAYPFIIKSLLSRATLKNETMAVESSNYLILLTQEESEALYSYYGRVADLIIPITISSKSTDVNFLSFNSPYPKPYLLFCGSYFPPNREALEWFVREVLDQISFDLVVIGYQMEFLTTKLKHPKLKIIGTVNELAPYYHFATAVVNPVMRGAGMNTKSVEAISYGKPLISTFYAIVGFPKELPSNIYPCSTASDFISAIEKLSTTSINKADLMKYFENNFDGKIRKDLFYKHFLKK